MTNLYYFLDVEMRNETTVNLRLRAGVTVVASTDVPIGIVPEAMSLFGYALLDDINRTIDRGRDR